MVTRERSYRGISTRAALGYLESVGGDQVDDRTVAGDGWRATVSAETVEVGPTLTITEVTVLFEGADGERLAGIIDQFSQKAIRAGG